MKKYLILYVLFWLIIVFNINLYSNNIWLKVLEDSKLPSSLKSCDSVNVVALCHPHGPGRFFLYHSNDGGFNWKEILYKDNVNMVIAHDVAYPAKNNIFVHMTNDSSNSIYNNLIIKYDDEGNALDSFSLDASYTHPWIQHRDRKIKMIDTLTGLVNIGSRIYLTNDGWKTFKIIRPDTVDNAAITRINMKDYNNFSFYYQRNGNYYYTTDAGKSFEIINFGSMNPIWDIYFLNDDIGYIVGSNSKNEPRMLTNLFIFKTQDKGRTWDIILDTIFDPRSSSTFIKLHMYDENIGTFVGSRGIMAMTYDGWKTFTRISLPTTKKLTVITSAVTYSGNRPIIAGGGVEQDKGSDIYTLVDTVYMNMGAPELIAPADLSKGLLVDVSFRWRKVTDIGKYVFQLAKDEKFTQMVRDDTLEVGSMVTSLTQDVFGLEN